MSEDDAIVRKLKLRYKGKGRETLVGITCWKRQ